MVSTGVSTANTPLYIALLFDLRSSSPEGKQGWMAAGLPVDKEPKELALTTYTKAAKVCDFPFRTHQLGGPIERTQHTQRLPR
jgi:hypothetical protein